MKFKGTVIFLVALLAIIAGRYFLSGSDLSSHAEVFANTSSVNHQPKSSEPGSSSQTSAASLSFRVSSAAASSKISLSGARVEALPEIVHFLNQLDNAIIPKIYLPDPKRDFNFDYRKSTPLEFKNKALESDPYAAYSYAEYLIKNKVRAVTDAGTYAYEPDFKKRIAAMDEAREFYIRAFRGGISSTADVLSRLYADPRWDGNRIEALAWRKISFAVGESQRYECLRNSTTCVVKDFNNLNRLEYFYPCLSSSGDSCTQNEYDTAMTLALQYADSLEFAMSNKVSR